MSDLLMFLFSASLLFLTNPSIFSVSYRMCVSPLSNKCKPGRRETRGAKKDSLWYCWDAGVADRGGQGEWEGENPFYFYHTLFAAGSLIYLLISCLPPFPFLYFTMIFLLILSLYLYFVSFNYLSNHSTDLAACLFFSRTLNSMSNSTFNPGLRSRSSGVKLPSTSSLPSTYHGKSVEENMREMLVRKNILPAAQRKFFMQLFTQFLESRQKKSMRSIYSSDTVGLDVFGGKQNI